MIDVLNETTGQKTGAVISKSEAHKTGIWHGSVHILLVSKDRRQTLLQKRSPEEKLYPNAWDIAVGGHISAGEDEITSAKRELKEELGIDSDDLAMEKVDRITEMLNNNDVISNEFVSIFVVYVDEELNQFIDEGIAIPHVREYEILFKQELIKD